MENTKESSHESNHLNGFPHDASTENVAEDISVSEQFLNMGINTDKDPSRNNLPSLLKVFQDVYDQRLSAIEENNNLDETEKNAEKLHVLKQYIEQLQEQNDTFVVTMAELETEAQQRVKQMEKRLKSSAKTTMEAAININECEKEMRRLVKERLYIESLYNDMQQHLSSLKVENGFLRDQNFNLNHDVQALLHIINHARSTGHWEMNCVTFCEVTPEQVFGPVQSISAVYTHESPRDDSEKRAVVSSETSSHCASDSNQSSPALVNSARSQSKYSSEEHLYDKDVHSEILEKSRRITRLEEKLSEVLRQLSMKEAECECHMWKMEMLMQHHKDKVQNFASEIPASNTSLSKCISLPDIGNIYHFSYAPRKSRSYDNCGNMQAFGYKYVSKKSSECIKDNHPGDSLDFEKRSAVHKRSENKSCINRGQSEPHLFMLGDNIYVYRPCEPIKKASNVALQDDFESSLPPCQSIDLKFPVDDSNTKINNWTSSDRKELYNVPVGSFCKEYEISSCSCSDSEIDDKESLDRSQHQVSKSVQTDRPVTYSIGLQAIVKRDDNSSLCNCFDPGVEKFDKRVLAGILRENGSVSTSQTHLGGLCEDVGNSVALENGSLQVDVPQIVNTIQLLKENLVKAEDKAQSKEILISQLQGHLISSVKEVEMKDTALQNLEKKLDISRSECSTLKEEISELNSEIQQILQDLENAQMLNDNLKLKADAREEKIQDVLSEVKMLQEQKRALMIQLDAQGDDFERTKEELLKMQHKAESSILQVDQQSQIIRNLQDALVQSKRAFDAAQQKLPNSHSVSSNFLSDTKSSPKTSIVDI